MFKKTFLGLVLIIMSITVANAALINYQGTGNFQQLGSGVGSTIVDTSLNQGMAFNNSDSLALLGYGGFDSFDLSLGEDMHFWYEDFGGNIMDLYGTITSGILSGNSSFQFFGVNSTTGTVYEVSGSRSFNDQGYVTSNSINVSGQFATVPEPGSLALMVIGLIGFISMKKMLKLKQDDTGYMMTAA